MGYKECVIFDIDGTMADVEHRRRYLDQKPKNWASYNNLMRFDPPKVEVVRLALVISQLYPVVLFSGREEVFRPETERWLGENEVPFRALKMRKAKDYRDDTLVKGEMLDELFKEGFSPWLVVDDRNKVVKMWRERGLTCL